MKKLRKIGLGLLIVIVALFGIAQVLLLIYEDDIHAAVDKAVAESVNADVYYDQESFGISLFSNFPNATVSLSDFGVANKAPFAGDTLVHVGKLGIEVNILSILSELSIAGITLDDVKLNIKVNEDGAANYDIAKETEEAAADSTASEGGDFNLSIDHWALNNASIIYDDASLGFYTKLTEVNHTGSGDISLSVYDLVTKTTGKAEELRYDGISYLSDKELDVDGTLHIDITDPEKMVIGFRENTIKVNDFGMQAEGEFAMLADAYEMDISFASVDNSFKSILSLVPGMFLEGFESLKTEGSMDFSGKVSGTYAEEPAQMPAFNLIAKVKDGMFQYPDLPAAVSNVQMDLAIDNPDGNLDNTSVNLSAFHLDFGNNPVDASYHLKNLGQMLMEGKVNAQLNLTELATMFPMEGLTMKGLFSTNASINGRYDSLKEIIPAMDISMKMENGYIKYAEYPAELSDIHFTSSVVNKTGNMQDMVIRLSDFAMLLDGEKLTAEALISDLADPAWEVHIHGGVDLAKVMQVYPMEGMNLSGKIKADVDSKGKLSNIEQEQYEKINTSGTMTVAGFKYSDQDYPQGVGIESAKASFDPQKITLTSMKGNFGRSDMQADGTITNYMAYALDENATLKGKINFRSSMVDINEWMVDEEAPSTDTASSEPLEVIPIPKNIDFVLNSSIDKVIYDNLELKNVKGDVVVRDGKAMAEDVNFNLLDGAFAMNGTYDTQDPEDPAFDFDVDIKDLSIGQAYPKFNTIQVLAPMARRLTGKFSTDFAMQGKLGQDMYPVMSSLSGQGLVNIVQATLQGSKVMSSVSALTKLSMGAEEAKKVLIEDVLMNLEIKDGKVVVKPFDLKIAGYKAKVGGASGIDGSIDYTMALDVPAGAAGAAFNNFLAQYGAAQSTGDKVTLNFNIGGSATDPKVGLAGTDAGDAAKAAAKAAAKEKVSSAIEDKTGVDVGNVVNKDTVKQEVKETVDSAKAEVKEEVNKATDEVKDKAKKKIKGLFGGSDDDGN